MVLWCVPDQFIHKSCFPSQFDSKSIFAEPTFLEPIVWRAKFSIAYFSLEFLGININQLIYKFIFIRLRYHRFVKYNIS